MSIRFEFIKHTSFLFLTLFIVLSACKKSDVNNETFKASGSGLLIKAGFECGWGSGMDSLVITQTSVKYVYYIPAQSFTPIINKTRAVSDTEWAEILNDLNIDDFVKLDYQTCNVCVDGCDEWIYVQNDTVSHKITFGKGYMINTIGKLQNKLTEIRAEFNK